LEKVTIIDIAKELKVTAATVSRALNNHPGISAETKQKVAEVANRLNYRTNKIASSLRSGKSHAIGVLIPSAEINFFGSVIHGIEQMANINGYNVLIYQTNESRDYEVKGIETFLSARVDGILVSIAKETTDYSHFTEIRKRGVPIVFFDRAIDDLGISSVTINDYKGAFMATEHLIKQGYKRIAHIAGPQHIKLFNDRLKGYMGALQANKIAIDPELIFTGNVSIDAGKRAVKCFFEKEEKPDAAFAVEDFTALGALKELKDRAVKVPEEFGLVGFANELFGEHITPSLSTIDQQTVLMGKKSFDLLLSMISRGNKDTLPQKIILEPIPVFRKSSVKNNHAKPK
jgi:LacI family transcriptional regulator